jgi:hypothetical protein
MKKLALGISMLLGFSMAYAQEIYFQTGKNFTNYDYEGNSSDSPNLQAGSGNFYEVAYVMTLNNEKLKYAVGLSLNEYNAIGGDSSSSYSWNTQYMGIDNTFSIAFVNWNGLQASANGGIGISSLIYGKQNLNGQYLDLSSQKEFSGLWIAPKLGITGSYNVDNDIYLSFGYAYSKNFNVSNNSDEKLSFNNNQIQFGVHFVLR